MVIKIKLDDSNWPWLTLTAVSGSIEVSRTEEFFTDTTREMVFELAEEHSDTLAEMLAELAGKLLPEER